MSDSTIAVVVDRNFGDQLLELAKDIPVWIAASGTNRTAVEATWALHKVHSAGYNVTIINAGANLSAENLLLSELYVIDEHHPFWSVMKIYGVALSPLLAEAFNGLEVISFYDVADGFVAVRSEPS